MKTAMKGVTRSLMPCTYPLAGCLRWWGWAGARGRACDGEWVAEQGEVDRGAETAAGQAEGEVGGRVISTVEAAKQPGKARRMPRPQPPHRMPQM